MVCVDSCISDEDSFDEKILSTLNELTDHNEWEKDDVRDILGEYYGDDSSTYKDLVEKFESEVNSKGESFLYIHGYEYSEIDE